MCIYLCCCACASWGLMRMLLQTWCICCTMLPHSCQTSCCLITDSTSTDNIAFIILSLRSIRIPNVVYQLTVTTLWGRLDCLVLNDMGKFLRSNVVWKTIFHRFFMKWRWDFKTAKGRGIMCRCSDIISRRLVCINGCGQVGIITLWWRKII